ncbi:hypothetical protein N9Y42_10910 [Mariniblastus sp.]|nr:hypothetical protein [Mariniblastus sp.]
MSPSVALDITEHLKPPRALFLPFMMGHQFGVPFHKQLQTEVVLACLTLLEQTIETSILDRFPKTWADARREGKQIAESLKSD